MAPRSARRAFLGGRPRVTGFRALLTGVALCIAAVRADAQANDSLSARPRQHDSLFGLDKPKHFALSFFVESLSFASIQAMGGSRRTAMSGASGTTALIAIGREIHDRKTKGLFSIGDLAWDALGAGAAVVMLRHTYR